MVTRPSYDSYIVVQCTYICYSSPLSGIPVYQQHLVYGGVELQDEFCLEEYGVRSGAQLKLLVAMRGGPIHAHRGMPGPNGGGGGGGAHRGTNTCS